MVQRQQTEQRPMQPLLQIDERPRRVRDNAALRDVVAETELSAARLALPVFALAGNGRSEPIAALPGHARRSADLLVDHLGPLVDRGLRHVMVFGVPDARTRDAASLYDAEGPAQQALLALDEAFGDRLFKMADVCLCPHADHGHCGVPVERRGSWKIDGDAALPLLGRGAVSLAEAGADWVAPSDMMDGRVAHMRSALDTSGFADVGILSYTAKFASALYGPFREAAGSAPSFGDRRGYQLDPRNVREALREARLDVQEGADMLMVKPAITNLDIIARIRQTVDVPMAAYHVSGEYAMAHAAAARGWLDLHDVLMESLVSIRRAGADLVLTYAAQDMLQEGWL